MNIKGFSTLKETKNYFFNHNISLSHVKYTRNFYSLPMALGTHLGDFSDSHSNMYKETLTYGLIHGINFIDTAINYRGMRSEKDIGEILVKLIQHEKAIKREEIVISTKGGQIYGDYTLGVHPIDYLNNILIPKNILNKEDVNIIDNHRHTLEPKFYKNCIELSKKNLCIDTIDIHYIHNPEISKYILGENVFYTKLEPLIYFYEQEVKKGTIKFYGMATWYAFIDDMDSKWYISLNKVMDIVKKVAGPNHHFKFIQVPYNKFNTSASTKKNQLIKNKHYSLMEAAQLLGLYVTISAPLNQCKNLNSTTSPKKLLNYVISNKNIYASMVGSKSIDHLKENLKTILET
ncbi:hypothetical protein C3495_03100 [Clostridiaceae bacterium 14S0207]|nr:hypothetical protein C3495_03100 [Clostridiaceae bacterium 14S0207]